MPHCLLGALLSAGLCHASKLLLQLSTVHQVACRPSAHPTHASLGICVCSPDQLPARRPPPPAPQYYGEDGVDPMQTGCLKTFPFLFYNSPQVGQRCQGCQLAPADQPALVPAGVRPAAAQGPQRCSLPFSFRLPPSMPAANSRPTTPGALSDRPFIPPAVFCPAGGRQGAQLPSHRQPGSGRGAGAAAGQVRGSAFARRANMPAPQAPAHGQHA